MSNTTKDMINRLHGAFVCERLKAARKSAGGTLPWNDVGVHDYDNPRCRPRSGSLRSLAGSVKEHPQLMALIEKSELVQKWIIKRCTVDPRTGCWMWNKYRKEGGYGQVFTGSLTALAHRVSFCAFKSNPGERLVCHKCNVTSCVNPAHLYAGDHYDNAADRDPFRHLDKYPKLKWHHLPKWISWEPSRKKYKVIIRGKLKGRFDMLKDAQKEVDEYVKQNFR